MRLCAWNLSSIASHAAKAVHVSFLSLTAGSLALGGSRVNPSSTAGLAAKHLGEAAHMTGTVKPRRQCVPMMTNKACMKVKHVNVDVGCTGTTWLLVSCASRSACCQCSGASLALTQSK